MEATPVSSRCLPETTAPHLASWLLDDTATLMTLHVTSTQRVVPRSVCAVFTRRVHSRDTPTLTDLPGGGIYARWQLRVRKFVGTHVQCRRRLVAERLSGVVALWARWTQRLMEWRIALARALGGTAGVRLRQRLGLMASRQTLLRVVRRLPLSCGSPPQVWGVDDDACCKRQTLGTVLIDLARRQLVAWSPDREAETLASWLRAHPGVETIARDRAKASADGARYGAPEVIQVADRFHLPQNLVDALAQVFHTYQKALAAVNDAIRHQGVPLCDGGIAVAVPPPLARRRRGGGISR